MFRQQKRHSTGSTRIRRLRQEAGLSAKLKSCFARIGVAVRGQRPAGSRWTMSACHVPRAHTARRGAASPGTCPEAVPQDRVVRLELASIGAKHLERLPAALRKNLK